jgi:pSer/pThr/pTyr-binding forkhead associated (FHA) protein
MDQLLNALTNNPTLNQGISNGNISITYRNGNQSITSNTVSSNTPLPPIYKKKPNEEEVLDVQCVSWTNKNFNLFDYKVFGHQMTQFQGNTSFRLGYKNGKIFKISESSEGNEEYEYTIDFQKINTTFSVKINTKENPKKKQKERDTKYIVVRSLLDNTLINNRNYILRSGDLIRFGNVKFQVNEIQSKNNQSKKLEVKRFDFMEDEIDNDCFDISESVEQIKKLMESSKLSGDNSKKIICRYCLLDSIVENELDDTFLSLCNCTGEFKYVHVYCLKKWIQQKIIVKSSDHLVAYKWKRVRCEMCYHKWPEYLKFNGIISNIYDVDRPADKSYMILEKQKEENKASLMNKEVFVIIENNDKNSFKVGTGFSNDIRVDDVSMDSEHAEFLFENNKFHVRDSDSRFGTLVKLRSDWIIRFKQEIIQVGRSIFCISKIFKQKK